MSDISISNITSDRKRRISELDETIEYLTNEVKNVKDFVNRNEFEYSLMTVKLKREKVNALTAVAKSRMLLADMDILIAESDLFSDVERLKSFKILKLENDEQGNLQKNISKKIPAPTTSTSVQTTNTYEKKKKHRSSKKAPVDISQDETVLIPKINVSTPSLGTSQSLTSFTPGLFNTPPNKSDSETSLSSSIKAEFDKPYTTPQALEPEKKPKKQKSEKKDSKSKSKHVSMPKHSPSTPKTVADLRKSVTQSHVGSNNMSLPITVLQSTEKANRPNIEDRNAASTSTYVPVRHNMPAVVSRPHISIADPRAYVNYVTQPYLQYHTQKLGNNQSYNFYGSQQ